VLCCAVPCRLTQGDQSREVVRVLVECCLQEARYNPYYGHLAARLAAVSKGYKVGRWLPLLKGSGCRMLQQGAVHSNDMSVVMGVGQSFAFTLLMPRKLGRAQEAGQRGRLFPTPFTHRQLWSAGGPSSASNMKPLQTRQTTDLAVPRRVWYRR
jgi:hypothetical protein